MMNERQAVAHGERRGAERRFAPLDAVIKAPGLMITARIVDISAMGCMVALPGVSLIEGTIYTLEVSVFRGIEVVASRCSGTTAALEFIVTGQFALVDHVLMAAGVHPRRAANRRPFDPPPCRTRVKN